LASMRETNFSTVLDGDWLVWHQTLVKYVHHFYLLSESNDNLETTWVQSEWVSFVTAVVSEV
jgi:hypothetical protein